MFDSSIYLNKNLQFPQVQQDYRDVKKHVDNTDNSIMYALESLPPARRLSSLPEKIKNGDYAPAVGLASLAILNLPEDLSDIKSSYEQLTQKSYTPKYDYKQVQHPFSFFRGTLLHKFVDPNTTKHPELTKKLLKADKTLVNTNWGKKILNFLGTNPTGLVETKIKDIGHTEAKPKFVNAKIYESKNLFGDLTARAMTRTTKLGVLALAAFETPKIFKALNQGDGLGEQAENGVKQTLKSGINLASITAGIAYGGAIGAKKIGTTGSLIGMAAGAIFGSFTSKKLQGITS